MKKVLYLLGIFLITLNFSSCHPESLTDDVAPQACCGDDIPPPPPPPPTGEGG